MVAPAEEKTPPPADIEVLLKEKLEQMMRVYGNE